ncbi:hypothetical protein ACH41E_07655 [Streptomyces sp. NPDC020412]|uniref:hypothetical protein n=1 Tax=Streptomyces sp. NPDC020412 TaxID=3365073 RepID=UPI0037B104E3
MSEAARRTARTVLQSAVGIAVVLPAIVDASGVPATLPWVAGALAVAATLARVMALDGVQRLLPPWLRTRPTGEDLPAAVSPEVPGVADDRL